MSHCKGIVLNKVLFKCNAHVEAKLCCWQGRWISYSKWIFITTLLFSYIAHFEGKALSCLTGRRWYGNWMIITTYKKCWIVRSNLYNSFSSNTHWKESFYMASVWEMSAWQAPVAHLAGPVYTFSLDWPAPLPRMWGQKRCSIRISLAQEKSLILSSKFQILISTFASCFPEFTNHSDKSVWNSVIYWSTIKDRYWSLYMNEERK